MRERISQLMDGELDDKSAAELIAGLSREGEAAEAWRTYHRIGDALRGTAPLSDDFTARVAWKLADQPSVLAPDRIRPEPRRWFTASAVAASLAAVALVGWLAFAPQNEMAPAPVAKVAVEAPPAIVPLPSGANDYLLAHQGFSPRVYLQGMAYVRTVAEQSVEPRK